MRHQLFCLLTGLLLLVASHSYADPLQQQDVPKPLKPWVNWVLQGVKDYGCPFIFNDFSHKQCAWPASALGLNLLKKRGRFTQSWQVYRESIILLPGDRQLWPQGVSVNDKLAVVIEYEGKPALKVNKGTYRIRGNFFWKKMPKQISLPLSAGVVALFVNGKVVKYPDIDNQGKLWPGEREQQNTTQQQQETDKLTIQVFRLLDDLIPMRVITRIELQVSGAPREISLHNVMLDKLIPMQITSRLPARLEQDGTMRVQVKPGKWAVTLTARAESDITELVMSVPQQHWPKQELWAFQARNNLRVVELQGVTRVDPRQTNMPETWHSYPVFLMQPGKVVKLKVIRRGNPQPEPDKLKLDRKIWLDFDGKGYSVQDKINGIMSHNWRLQTDPELVLGRVLIDNKPRFITSLSGGPPYGVEVRRGKLNLVADSRFEERISSMPVTGWQQRFNQVNTTLYIPPGWKVFAAIGVDNSPYTWLQRWTLLDLFLVLIISFAIGKLWGWQWGGVAMVAMALIWHEPGLVPRNIWLNLIAVITLLRYTKTGRVHKFLMGYRNISLLVLLLISIPFLINQVRTAIYPQLERAGYSMPVSAKSAALKQQAGRVLSPALEIAGRVDSLSKDAQKYKRGTLRSRKKEQPAYQDIVDPRANVQTGPGLPDWQWKQIRLAWYGPVDPAQSVHVILIPPLLNAVLNLLRVILVIAMCLLMLNSLPQLNIRGIPKITKLVMLIILLPVFGLGSQDSYAEMPDQNLLTQLKQRLTAAPECLPRCAQFQLMVLQAAKDTIQIQLEVHTQQAVFVPLPARVKQWLPNRITVDGRSNWNVFRAKDGVLWIKLPKGRFRILLTGTSADKKHIQLPLQLKPKRIVTKLSAWQVQGINEEGLADDQLQLTRIATQQTQHRLKQLESGSLPPFVLIERTLKLGLDWYVETSIRRLSPVGEAIVLNVPLLEGESVITEGIHTELGKVLINMSPRQIHSHWLSSLKKTRQINLKASALTYWTEIWRLDVSPVWHMTAKGISVIQHVSQQGNWLPEWHPWQNEEVTLTITRPKGVDGQTLTIDRSNLQIQPGKRSMKVSLDMSLRSSQGGQYQLELPEDVELQSIKINNQPQSIRTEGQLVTLPISPGKQTLHIEWLSKSGLKNHFVTPAVNLKQASVNHVIRMKMGADRWILFTGGPRLGPAVLFWGALIVILILAFGLSKTGLTPLGFVSWFLLGIGLSQIPILMGGIVVGWLLLLGTRKYMLKGLTYVKFNLLQVGIGFMTLLAFGSLFFAVQHGLLGTPEMQIAGNYSSVYQLNWYQDRIASTTPTAWVFSVPRLVYRLLMLVWALWMAFALLKWLRWGWGEFMYLGVWRKNPDKSAGVDPGQTTKPALENGSANDDD